MADPLQNQLLGIGPVDIFGKVRPTGKMQAADQGWRKAQPVPGGPTLNPERPSHHPVSPSVSSDSFLFSAHAQLVSLSLTRKEKLSEGSHFVFPGSHHPPSCSPWTCASPLLNLLKSVPTSLPRSTEKALVQVIRRQLLLSLTNPRSVSLDSRANPSDFLPSHCPLFLGLLACFLLQPWKCWNALGLLSALLFSFRIHSPLTPIRSHGFSFHL